MQQYSKYTSSAAASESGSSFSISRQSVMQILTPDTTGE
jgi:hypothetical protein